MTTSPTEGAGAERAGAGPVAGARSSPAARAMIFGTGLIGGSMGLALRHGAGT